MKTIAKPLTADQILILQYLQKHPEKFMSEADIAQQADDQKRYWEDPLWPNLALFQLTEMKLLKIGEDGGYRVKVGLLAKCLAGEPRVQLGPPDIEDILLKHGFCCCLKHQRIKGTPGITG